MPIHLDDPVALLLEKFQNPPVKVVAIVIDVPLDHTGGDQKPGSGDLFTDDLSFFIIKDAQAIQEILAFLLENVLIGAAIPATQQLDGFSFAAVPQCNLDPGPVIQGCRIDLGNERDL